MDPVLMESMTLAMQEIQLWGMALLVFMAVMIVLLVGQVTRIVVKMDQLVNQMVPEEKEE